VDVKGKLYGFSVAGSNSYEFFLWGYLKEDVYAVSPRLIEDLMTVFEAAVTMVSAVMLKGPIHDQSCCATLRVVQHD
jgi:hypothetical protein